jgi:hypothetical protein
VTSSVVAALVQRRAELAGRIETMQGELQQLHADLACLDAVIRQFDPERDVGAIRPKYRRAPTAAEFGSISRTVLDVLRRAGEPLSAAAIADRIIAERGLNAGDRALVRSMGKRVAMALRYQRTNGMVEEAEVEGRLGMWEIAR